MSLTKVTYSMIKGAMVNVLDYGADPTGTTDSLAAIQAAIDAGKPYNQYATTGVEIYLPAGKYKVTNSIDMTDCSGVHLVGAGAFATEIVTTATNSPVIIFSGSDSSNNLQSAGIREMTIRGGSNSSGNTLAYGIKSEWTNSCIIENVNVFTCFIGIYVRKAWQTVLQNIRMFGSSGDACRSGLWLAESNYPSEAIDNAVIADNVNIQNTLAEGIRIVTGQGSKFSNCEVGSAATHGWYIGSPNSATVPCQWLHIVNCLADSCGSTNWYIVKGNATTLGEMIFTGIWTGNSGDRGFAITGGTDIQVNGLIAITCPANAIDIGTSTRIQISDVSARQWNSSNNGYACVNLYNTTDSLVNGVEGYSTYGDYSVLESGTSTDNLCMNLAFHPLLIGASSCSIFKDTDGSLTIGSEKPFKVLGTSIIGPQITTTDGPTLYVNQQEGSGNIGIEVESNISSTAYQLMFRNSNGQVGSIQTSGSATSYVTSSDYRLKENIEPMSGALDKVMQLNPVTYTWKIDGESGQGFIAHELQAVVPDCVTGEKDGVDENGNPIYQGVDTSFLVATLAKAIQELNEKVENLNQSNA